MLLHPGDGLVADAEGLSHDHADKGAQRTDDQHQENQEREHGGERFPSAKEPRDPAIKRRAQAGEERSEQERLQERPDHREEQSRHRQHEEKDKRGSKISRVNFVRRHAGSIIRRPRPDQTIAV